MSRTEGQWERERERERERGSERERERMSSRLPVSTESALGS